MSLDTFGICIVLICSDLAVVIDFSIFTYSLILAYSVSQSLRE